MNVRCLRAESIQHLIRSNSPVRYFVTPNHFNVLNCFCWCQGAGKRNPRKGKCEKGWEVWPTSQWEIFLRVIFWKVNLFVSQHKQKIKHQVLTEEIRITMWKQLREEISHKEKTPKRRNSQKRGALISCRGFLAYRRSESFYPFAA